jgi:cationic amino acid transporter 3
MSRIVYSMANDGLLLKFLSSVNSKFKTPTFAIILTGFSSSVLTLLLDLNQLIEMMSIGTLMAYTVVSICVIILRYRPPSIVIKENSLENDKKKSQFSLLKIFKDIFIKNFDNCCLKTARNANISTFFCRNIFSY